MLVDERRMVNLGKDGNGKWQSCPNLEYLNFLPSTMEFYHLACIAMIITLDYTQDFFVNNTQSA